MERSTVADNGVTAGVFASCKEKNSVADHDVRHTRFTKFAPARPLPLTPLASSQTCSTTTSAIGGRYRCQIGRTGTAGATGADWA